MLQVTNVCPGSDVHCADSPRPGPWDGLAGASTQPSSGEAPRKCGASSKQLYAAMGRHSTGTSGGGDCAAVLQLQLAGEHVGPLLLCHWACTGFSVAGPEPLLHFWLLVQVASLPVRGAFQLPTPAAYASSSSGADAGSQGRSAPRVQQVSCLARLHPEPASSLLAAYPVCSPLRPHGAYVRRLAWCRHPMGQQRKGSGPRGRRVSKTCAARPARSMHWIPGR